MASSSSLSSCEALVMWAASLSLLKALPKEAGPLGFGTAGGGAALDEGTLVGLVSFGHCNIRDRSNLRYSHGLTWCFFLFVVFLKLLVGKFIETLKVQAVCVAKLVQIATHRVL